MRAHPQRPKRQRWSYFLAFIFKADVVHHRCLALRSLSYLNRKHLQAIVNILKRLLSAVQQQRYPIFQHRHKNKNEKWYLFRC